MQSPSGSPKPAIEPAAAPGREALRWACLLAGALWLAHPYFSPHLIGTGDALWYHHLLADAVRQFRAGEFPLYVGQSEFMFNGAVYPHRVAPYHQYLAGLLDLLTGRTLGFFALQHLTIILSFVGGAFGAYHAATRLAPAHRWPAAGLALLYVACPGVMGLAYAQDLYMSVMTLPWVPLALGGAWLTFREYSWRALGALVLGLGALWWSHPPIAMWVTALAGLQQAVCLARLHPVWPRLGRGLAAAGLLAALVAYPFVSALLLRAPGESVVPYRMDRALLLKEIHDAFPACLLPLDPTASPLSQLQLGYALWLLLAGVIALAAWRRRMEGLVAGALAAFLLVLVLPVPGLTRPLWLAFPESVVGLSLYWPMQRLYIIAAGLTIISAAELLAGVDPRRARHLLAAALLLGLTWSLREAVVFQSTARERAAANTDSAKWARPENVTPMRHAYHLFSRQPDTMSNGVMDPQLESRLLDPVNGNPLPTPAPAGPWAVMTGTLDANPGILNLEPTFTLLPGRRYWLRFDFFTKDYTGVLQLIGPEFFREYALPSSGKPRAFGTKPEAAHILPLSTSGPDPVVVQLRFIPTQAGVRAESFSPFARFSFVEVDSRTLHVELHSLVPYQVTVRSPVSAILETPRVLVPGYEAIVNGKHTPVLSTPQGFVGVPVPEGTSEIRIQFTGPIALRAAFALSALSWLSLPLAIVWSRRRPVD